LFVDRADAGKALAEEVARQEGLVNTVVVALPRGGVPVGAEIARRLESSLMVMPVAKVGAPGREELALGAVAPGGVEVLNDDVVAALHLGDSELRELVARAAARVSRQVELYGGGEAALPLEGRAVVVVDDGLATGASMRAALLSVRTQAPARAIVAVPVAPPEVLASLASLTDAQVCLIQPARMEAVGVWYEDFTQTSDEEVLRLLAEANGRPAGTRRGSFH
jgi:putative phosphoribosyl transferase